MIGTLACTVLTGINVALFAAYHHPALIGSAVVCGFCTFFCFAAYFDAATRR